MSEPRVVNDVQKSESVILLSGGFVYTTIPVLSFSHILRLWLLIYGLAIDPQEGFSSKYQSRIASGTLRTRNFPD
jgi:hypothetical protein